MVVVVGTHFLDEPIVEAVEGDIDTDDLEWFGANPRNLALCVVEETGFGRIVGAESSFLCFVHFLVLHPAVEDLGFFRLNEDLLLEVKLHRLVGWHQADGDVPMPCGVVPEEDVDSAIPVVNHFPGD